MSEAEREGGCISHYQHLLRGLCQPTGTVTELCLAMRKPNLYIPPSWVLVAKQEVYRERVDRAIDFQGKGKEW